MSPAQPNIPLSTSEKHPIHVDFVPAEALNLPGRLGLTIAPGKQNVGMQFLWQRNLALDLDRLRHHYHVDTLVSLIEEAELSQLKIPHLFSEVQQAGMRSLWFPIPDFSAPRSMPATVSLVREILGAVRQGKTVVTHCKGGLGRSGLIVAACLTTLGYSAAEAFIIIRKARPGSVETQVQEEFVKQFAQGWEISDRAS
ncbi:MAG: cyclin-dependent kinase inhibitor 3 family protein [Leptolyngbyaceae cyanobacterium bins.349]|nr:cyclin-dependent kinase inhibitor 3 family protein [Leptolyngbyaceae cyanobacterium bins.349]